MTNDYKFSGYKQEKLFVVLENRYLALVSLGGDTDDRELCSFQILYGRVCPLLLAAFIAISITWFIVISL